MGKKKRQRGRPRKLETQVDRKRFLAILRNCCGVRKAACRKFGIDFKTLTSTEERDPKFAEQVRDAAESVLDDIEVNTFAMAIKDPTLGIRVLKCKRPDEWSEKQRVSHEGTIGLQVVEDPGWFGNDAHSPPAESPPPPAPSDPLAGTDEAPGLR